MKANILTAAPAVLLALALGCTDTDPMEPTAAPTRTAAADSADTDSLQGLRLVADTAWGDTLRVCFDTLPAPADTLRIEALQPAAAAPADAAAARRHTR